MEGERERERKRISTHCTLYNTDFFGGGGDWHKNCSLQKKNFKQSMQFTASEKFTLHNM